MRTSPRGGPGSPDSDGSCGSGAVPACSTGTHLSPPSQRFGTTQLSSPLHSTTTRACCGPAPLRHDTDFIWPDAAKPGGEPRLENGQISRPLDRSYEWLRQRPMAPAPAAGPSMPFGQLCHRKAGLQSKPFGIRPLAAQGVVRRCRVAPAEDVRGASGPR